MASAKIFTLEKAKFLLSGKELTLCHTIMLDNDPTQYAFWKLEGHDGPVSLHWLIHEIPSYQALQYLGIGLTFSQTTKFRLFQIERVCRRRF